MSASRYYAYIGTNSVRGSRGIYTVAVDAHSLVPEVVSVHPAYNAGSLALSADSRRLYAAVEGMTFRGLADGGVVGYAAGPGGVLTELGGAPSQGQRPCCVALGEGDRHLYCANFYRGTLGMFDLDENGSPLPARLVVEAPELPGARHALHCVEPFGDRYVGVISLGECALVVHAVVDGRRITAFPFPGKPFPRYLAYRGGRVYAMMQDPGDIYVFEDRLDQAGELRLIQTVSVQREGYSDRFGTTTLRATPDGRLMLAATRRANSLSVFRIGADGRLELVDIVTLPGETPRDFNISADGRFAVTALQKSDQVCVHEIDSQHATLRLRGGPIPVPSPAAVAISGRWDLD